VLPQYQSRLFWRPGRKQWLQSHPYLCRNDYRSPSITASSRESSTYALHNLQPSFILAICLCMLGLLAVESELAFGQRSITPNMGCDVADQTVIVAAHSETAWGCYLVDFFLQRTACLRSPVHPLRKSCIATGAPATSRAVMIVPM